MRTKVLPYIWLSIGSSVIDLFIGIIYIILNLMALFNYATCTLISDRIEISKPFEL